jgi:hypothetical protein
MKHLKWQILLSASLLALSAIVYLIHYAIFRDAHHIFIYMIGDIAFVFTEVLLVTIIIHQVLAFREKRLLLEKLNMIIGAFFSEVGKELLKLFATFDPQVDRIRQSLVVTDRWSTEQFLEVSKRLTEYRHDIDITRNSLDTLKQTLVREREFLLRLLENQNLLEHDSFTSLLMAVFHLTEELESRGDFAQIPEADRKHLANDMKRAYSLLISEWLSYMKHLKENFPYLFSFAMRTNPFDPDATPEVKT